MLAIRLHKARRPFLGTRAYLIPVTTWAVAKVQVRNWIPVLNRHNRRRPNNAIRYITLVKIPDDHLVALHFDWVCSLGVALAGVGFDFHPLSAQPRELKEEIATWWDGDRRDAGRPLCDYPEMILGAPLPRSAIKWTKDIHLLYGSGSTWDWRGAS